MPTANDDAPVLTFTDDTFEADVLGADRVTLVEFWAPWCAPCRQVDPVIRRLARRFAGRARVGKLNVAYHEATAIAQGVKTIPTLKIYCRGEAKATLTGTEKLQELGRRVEQMLEAFDVPPDEPIRCAE
jgi:thioredoxin 1